MEAAAGGGAGPGNIARIHGNFRFHQNNVEHTRGRSSPIEVLNRDIVDQMERNYKQKLVKSAEKYTF